jgi:SAM-dependent methyltransferase
MSDSTRRFISRLARKLLKGVGKDSNLSSEDYWTTHNVTNHRQYTGREQSLDSFYWRSRAYFGYLELMPVTGADGLDVLDYGCGPGHDLVGFCEFSNPHSLTGVDVSGPSLEEAHRRLVFHDSKVTFLKIEESTPRLPIKDASMDLVHCSGVLHHLPDAGRVLREFARILRPNGEAHIMVYHYDSLWMHLHTAWCEMVAKASFPGRSKREAFRALTDGPDCPISNCYHSDEFTALALRNGFGSAVFKGAAISAFEMSLLPLRFNALQDPRLDAESRNFLYNLTFDHKGLPLFEGKAAGIDACFVLRH